MKFDSSEFPGMTYELHPESYKQLDDEVRQIAFTVTVEEDSSDHDDDRDDATLDIGEPIKVGGMVQVKCRTRQVRIFDSHFLSKTGEFQETPTPWLDLSWGDLQDHGPDRHLYERLCGHA